MRGEGLFTLIALTGLLLVLLLASACSPASAPVLPTPASPDGPQYGGVLVLANRGDPPAAFDSMRTSSIALHHVGGAIFGPGNLVKRCRENMYLICPDLATQWSANTGLTEWTFTIRRDVSWHDGEPFTPEDVKFWFDLALFGYEAPNGDEARAPAYFRGELGDVQKVEVTQHGQVVVTLGTPNPFFPEVLANPRFKIAHPKHLMEERLQQGEVSIGPLDVGLVGTGPFVFEEYQQGSLVRVRRFDQYWERQDRNQLPYLEGIDYVIMPDETAMDVAFRTGRLDGTARGEGHYLTTERQAGYERDFAEDEVFYAEMQGGLFRLGFNLLKEGPWQDARVRRAVSLWIDKEAAITAAMGGHGYISPILGPSNPFTSNAFTNWPSFNRDSLEERRAEAQRLMAEAGYADGFSMGYLCRATLVPRCEFLHGQLAGLNIDLRIQVVDEAEWNRGRVSLDYDSYPGAHTTPHIPEATESVFGRYSQNPDAYAKHEDPQIDEFYRLLRVARNHDQRVKAWRDLERYLVDEQAYVVPIAGSLQVVAYRSYVKGLAIPPEDGHTHTDFATVWLEK
jgi:peptide/nickel transport system substrate-binding protein